LENKTIKRIKNKNNKKEVMNKMPKTTEEIFNKCIIMSKTSVDLGLDENYELKNCRDIWKKEKWYSEEEIINAIKQSTADIKLGSVLIHKNEFIRLLSKGSDE